MLIGYYVVGLGIESWQSAFIGHTLNCCTVHILFNFPKLNLSSAYHLPRAALLFLPFPKLGKCHTTSYLVTNIRHPGLVFGSSLSQLPHPIQASSQDCYLSPFLSPWYCTPLLNDVWNGAPL